MEQILQGEIWTQVAQLLGDEPRASVTAAIAYITTTEQLSFQKDDVLLCDAEEDAIRSRRTAAKVLRTFHDSGVTIYSVPNLHAKVLTCGPHTVVGSANLSARSANVLEECSLLTDSPSVGEMMNGYLDRLMRDRTPLSTADIERLEALPVDPPTPHGQPKKTSTTPSERGKVWLVRTVPIDVHAKREQSSIQRQLDALGGDPDYIRYSGNSAFRRLARIGDWVIEASGSGDTSGRLKVSPPARIVARQDAGDGKWTRFYFVDREEPAFTLSALINKLPKEAFPRLGKWFARECSTSQRSALSRVWRRLKA